MPHTCSRCNICHVWGSDIFIYEVLLFNLSYAHLLKTESVHCLSCSTILPADSARCPSLFRKRLTPSKWCVPPQTSALEFKMNFSMAAMLASNPTRTHPSPGSSKISKVDHPQLPQSASRFFIDGAADLPSGKLTYNYGNSLFLMGKSTINGHFQ